MERFLTSEKCGSQEYYGLFFLRNLSISCVKDKNHLRIVYTYDLRTIFIFALLMKKFLGEK